MGYKDAIQELKNISTLRIINQNNAYLHSNRGLWRYGFETVEPQINNMKNMFFQELKKGVRQIISKLKIIENNVYSNLSINGIVCNDIDDLNILYQEFLDFNKLNNSNLDFGTYISSVLDFKSESAVMYQTLQEARAQNFENKELNKQLQISQKNKKKAMKVISNVTKQIAGVDELLNLYKNAKTEKVKKEYKQKISTTIDKFCSTNGIIESEGKKYFQKLMKIAESKNGGIRFNAGIITKSNELGYASEPIFTALLNNFLGESKMIPQKEQNFFTTDAIAKTLNGLQINISLKTSVKIDENTKRIVDAFTASRDGTKAKASQYSFNDSITQEIFGQDFDLVKYVLLNNKAMELQKATKTIEIIKNMIAWSLVPGAILGTTIGVGPNFNFNTLTPQSQYPILILGLKGFHSVADFLNNMINNNFFWISSQLDFMKSEIFNSGIIGYDEVYKPLKQTKIITLKRNKQLVTYKKLKQELEQHLKVINSSMLKNSKYKIHYRIGLNSVTTTSL